MTLKVNKVVTITVEVSDYDAIVLTQGDDNTVKVCIGNAFSLLTRDEVDDAIEAFTEARDVFDLEDDGFGVTLDDF